LSYAPSTRQTWRDEERNSSPEPRVSVTVRCCLLLAVILLATGTPVAAQGSAPERWQILLDGGEYLWDLRLGSLQGDSLTVRQADSTFAVPVVAMQELRLIQKSTMRIGDDASSAVVARALTGGDDEVFDLGGLEFAERLRVLREVLARHPSGL